MTSNHQLSESELQKILDVFRNFPQISKVVLFGSRAKGTAKPYSDIDLAYWGNITTEEANHLYERLDTLPLPYRFDLQNYNAINSDSLKDHIDRIGIVLL